MGFIFLFLAFEFSNKGCHWGVSEFIIYVFYSQRDLRLYWTHICSLSCHNYYVAVTLLHFSKCLIDLEAFVALGSSCWILNLEDCSFFVLERIPRALYEESHLTSLQWKKKRQAVMLSHVDTVSWGYLGIGWLGGTNGDILGNVGSWLTNPASCLWTETFKPGRVSGADRVQMLLSRTRSIAPSEKN